MKNIFTTLAFGAFLTLSICVISCSQEENATKRNTKEYTSMYICPMHCKDSGGDHMGKCPVCKMDYVKNKAHAYACEKHPEQTGRKGQDCSICGNKFSERKIDHSGHNH